MRKFYFSKLFFLMSAILVSSFAFAKSDEPFSWQKTWGTFEFLEMQPTDGGCLSATGQYPSSTITTVCLGTPQRIVKGIWAGQYSKVDLSAGVLYTFTSSVTTDFLTVSDEDGTVVLAFGTATVNYTPTSNQIIRLYVHKDESCTEEASSRTTYVQCGEPLVITSPNFPCYYGDGLASGNIQGTTTISETWMIAADDFIVEYDLAVKQVRLNVVSNTDLTNVSLTFRADDEGLPGEVLNTVSPTISSQRIINQNEFGNKLREIVVDLSSDIDLEAGTYWLQPHVKNVDNTTVNWELTSTGTTGNPSQTSYDSGTTWNADWNGNNAVFFVAGNCEVEVQGCLNAPYGAWPHNMPITPLCDGYDNEIVGAAYPGDFTYISVTEGVEYEFKVSIPTYLITIGNEEGTEVLASAIGNLIWTPDFTGVIRYYSHINEECETGPIFHARTIKCGETPDPPINDLCENAIPLSCGDSDSGNTYYATNTGGSESNDVYYSYTGNGNREIVTVDLCGSSYNTLVRVFKGCDLNTQIAINDDSLECTNQQFNSLVRFTSDGTSTYIIMVEGVANSRGLYEIAISCENLQVPQSCDESGSQDFGENAYYFSGDIGQQLAIDIPVGENGFTLHGIIPVLFGSATSFEFNLYGESYGLPGELIQTIEGTIVNQETIGWDFGQDLIKYTVTFDTPVELQPNRVYWLEPITDALMWGVTEYVPARVGTYGAFFNNYTNGNWMWLDKYEFTYDLICEELNVSDLDKELFSYYPNPVNDVLTIQSKMNMESISVFNLAGQKVLENVKETNGKVDMKYLASGTYIFRVKLESGQIETFKIVKK